MRLLFSLRLTQYFSSQNLLRHYEALGIPPSSTSEEVKQAYLRLTKLYQKDKLIESSEKLQKIALAYHILSRSTSNTPAEPVDRPSNIEVETVKQKGLGPNYKYLIDRPIENFHFNNSMFANEKFRETEKAQVDRLLKDIYARKANQVKIPLTQQEKQAQLQQEYNKHLKLQTELDLANLRRNYLEQFNYRINRKEAFRVEQTKRFKIIDNKITDSQTQFKAKLSSGIVDSFMWADSILDRVKSLFRK